MSLDEEALEAVANGGMVDLEKWPAIASPLLERLEYIVYNVFPMPRVPQGTFDHHLPSQALPQSTETSTVPPDSSNKENAAPANPQTPPPVPAPVDSSPATERVPDSQPQPSTQPPEDSLPPPLALLLNCIRSSIHSYFMKKPPHTIQRLAELILRPTDHYKTLPAYLRAVDRVVSVTSAADVFPFEPFANTSSQSNGLTHSTTSAGTYLIADHMSGLGSDESWGGALLTPIPWLTNTSLEGNEESAMAEEPEPPQPQEAETVVTATPEAAEGNANSQRTSASPPAESPDEVPHARGPRVVGVEDLGLQDGKGVEMNLGEEGVGDAAADQDANESSTEALTTELSSSVTASGTADQDGDIVLEDPEAEGAGKSGDTTTAALQTGDEKAESVNEAKEASDSEKKE